jgi:Zn-dependent M28 family amino/carboxypeptidase
MTPIPVFSGERAFRHLVRQTEFGPRNPNSKGHKACLDYLAQTLRGVADEVQVQPFSAEGYAEVLALTNIIAKFNVSAKSRILLCAHWDTRPRADQDTTKSKRNDPIIGANDGASGVAVLLEIAALLKQQAPPVGVDIVLFDGEDYGTEGDLTKYFLGSRYFAANKPADYNPRFGILLDMVGDTFLELRKEQHSVRFAPDIVDLVWRKARELGYSQFVDELGEDINDDHLQLNTVGIKTIDLIDFDYPDPTNRYWHTHDDTPDKCSPASLEAVGTVVTHIVYTQAPVP